MAPKARTAKAFDWSAPRFIPVQAEVRKHEVVLKAGGARAVLKGHLFDVTADHAVRSRWTVKRQDYLIFALTLQCRENTLVEEIAWFRGAWEPACEIVVSSSFTGFTDNVMFVRRQGVSFFISLDFPYSRIHRGQGVSYPAHERLPANAALTGHTLSVGACRLSGIKVNQLDRAEIEAVSAYVETRHPQRFERPQFLSASIVNRYTDVREGRIFYTMKDQPTLFLNPQLLAEDIRLMARLGIEYYQLFEGFFDWPDTRRTGAALRNAVKLGKKLGVRVGDYMAGSLFCPHYNYSHRRWDQLLEDMGKTRWMRISAKGERGVICLGDRECADWLIQTVVRHLRTSGARIFCLDMWSIFSCHAPGHGHPPGDIYQQVKGLVRFMQAMNAISPDFLVFTNIGIFSDLMPKLTWFNPNCYLTDPHTRVYASNVNNLKYLGDARREQMVSMHDRHFIPWRHYTNCEYYAYPGSLVHDLRFFEYSFLQGLAVTPNICPAELRPFLNSVPSGQRDACEAFMRRWMAFVRKHFHVWKSTARVGDAPGVGKAEIYAHMLPQRGYVCLINPNPFPRTARFGLDGSIGLSSGTRFIVREIYPQQCLIAEQSLPYNRRGDLIECGLAPHSVRYLEIRPYQIARKVLLAGLAAKIYRTERGYRARLRAPQGCTRRLGLVLPKGAEAACVSARQAFTVPMYTFPAGAKIAAQHGRTAFIDVTFPRAPAPRALTQWTVVPSGVKVCLPQINRTAFLGALVHNAFSEDLDIELDITTRRAPLRAGLLRPAPPCAPSAAAPVPAAKAHTFRAEFNLPFIARPSFVAWDDHCLLELAFADPRRVRSLAARLNGNPAEVRKYFICGSREFFAYYIDLFDAVKPGRVTLELDLKET